MDPNGLIVILLSLLLKSVVLDTNPTFPILSFSVSDTCLSVLLTCLLTLYVGRSIVLNKQMKVIKVKKLKIPPRI